jgi:hypothetical protein
VPSPQGHRVAVVVPNWNGADRLPACLESLAGQHHPVTIVVVENGSVDQSAAVLDELTERLRPASIVTLTNATNLGFAGGVNVGIRWALEQGHDTVALFNNDAVAEPDWLDELVGALDAHPECGIATGRLLMHDGETVDSTGDFYSVWGLPFPRDRDLPAGPDVRPSGKVFAASGGASLYRRELFEAIGLFDEEFFAYLEDVDLSFRAQLAGFEVWYQETAVAYHAQGSTSATVSGFATHHSLKNMPLLLVKDVPLRWLPGIGGRFCILYPLLVVNALRRRETEAALTALTTAARLLPRALRQRRRIQRSSVADLRLLRGLLWPALPPGLVLARRARDRIRRLLGLPPLRDGTHIAYDEPAG